MSSVSEDGQFLRAAAKCQDAWHVRLLQHRKLLLQQHQTAAAEKAAVACHLQLSSIICQTEPTTWGPRMPHCISRRQPVVADAAISDAAALRM